MTADDWERARARGKAAFVRGNLRFGATLGAVIAVGTSFVYGRGMHEPFTLLLTVGILVSFGCLSSLAIGLIHWEILERRFSPK